MKVVLINQDTKQDVEADVFDQVTYFLHESFGAKAKQGKQSSRLQGPFLDQLRISTHNEALPHLEYSLLTRSSVSQSSRSRPSKSRKMAGASSTCKSASKISPAKNTPYSTT